MPHRRAAKHADSESVVDRYQWREEPQVNVTSALFGTEKPRNIGGGVVAGTKSVLKGVGMGVGSLVAGPVTGYKEGGATGLLKGAGLGVVGAVALPVTGVAVGVKRVGQGFQSTAQGFKEENQGKVFDERTGKWMARITLDEELEAANSRKVLLEEAQKKLYAASEARATGSPLKEQNSGDVAETAYYDLLGVKTNATPDEIRKAYYKLARECHPDKHGGDVAMKEKFQEVGEAYQILSDAERRLQYDKYGKGAMQDMYFVDPSILFAMLFGSEAFEPFIGEFRLASLAADAPDNPIFMTEDRIELAELATELQKSIQRLRVARLAVNLRDRLQPYVDAKQQEVDEATEERWLATETATAKELGTESFGPELLDAVGFAYENYGAQVLDKKDQWYGAAGAKYKMRRRRMDTTWGIYSSATKIMKEQKAVEKRHKVSGSSSEVVTEEDNAAMSRTLEHFLKTILGGCVIDIIETLGQVCKKVIEDPKLTQEDRRLRAEAMKRLGKLYQRCASEQLATQEKSDAVEKIESAYIKANAKADGKRHPV